MRYINLFIYTFALLLFSKNATALALIDAKVPSSLQNAYDMRYQDPLQCISAVNTYLFQQKAFTRNNKSAKTHGTTKKPLTLLYVLPTHLQAFCYSQIEDYPNALKLLQPLFKKTVLSLEDLTTLSLIALEIPEKKRPQFSNLYLLKTLKNIDPKKVKLSPYMKVLSALTIAHLALKEDNYHLAFFTLEQARAIPNKTPRLNAWVSYYYGVYYSKIDQPQLAIYSFQLAGESGFINLNGLAKKGVIDVYTSKHRFQTALNYAAEYIDIYYATKNIVKQANGLINYAILKRKSNQYNRSLIYLFNALELIQHNSSNNKNKNRKSLLAKIHLELGHTYLLERAKNLNNLQLSERYLRNALMHFKALNNREKQIEALLLLAKLQIIKHSPVNAITELNNLLKIAKSEYPALRIQAFKMLASTYKEANNLTKSVEFYSKYIALEETLKNKQFTLQQLQVTEQLQLFKIDKQRKDLEIGYENLLQEIGMYKMASYTLITFLLLVAFLCFYIFRRHGSLNHAHQYAQQRLSVHPRTNLPFQYADSNHFQYTYHEEPLYYALLNIPFLSQLNELLGTHGAMKIEKRLGERLQAEFNDNTDVFQFRGNQILFIAKQTKYATADLLANEIEAFFNQFCEEHELSAQVSCGIVAYPFLNKAPRAFSASRTLNLSSLALFAASQIRKKEKQSSWVELHAIENLQPAFFNGDLWQLGYKAIEKSLIKINSSHPGFPLNWPQSNK